MSQASARGRRIGLASIAFLAMTTLAISGSAARAGTPVAPAVAAPTDATSLDPVIQWNRVLLGILNTPGAQPATIHATRNLAILHAAIYDAVDSIERKSAPYIVSIKSPRRADPVAAASAAGYTVLSNLYPGQQETVAAQFASLLAQVPNGYHKYEGVRIGEATAQALLALRADDGSSNPQPVFVPGTQPGDYQLTPPTFAQPAFTQWPTVRPFALRSASQFRPAPPPALTSKAYTAAYQEVQSLGSINSTTRTADQTQIAQFWNPPIWIAWNNIAETSALAHHDTLLQNARLFALLNVTFADSVIAFYDAKYTYRFWRPVTAIRAGDSDGNAATAGDPNWTPLAPTAQDPSYPGAHAVISAAAANVLASFFGGDKFAFSAQSTALPGVTRSFSSFSAAANEASLSRIYAGQHFRTDEAAGQQLGNQVADYVLQKTLQPTTAVRSS
jgi:membrane-associated phospholipid phosphatase